MNILGAAKYFNPEPRIKTKLSSFSKFEWPESASGTGYWSCTIVTRTVVIFIMNRGWRGRQGWCHHLGRVGFKRTMSNTMSLVCLDKFESVTGPYVEVPLPERRASGSGGLTGLFLLW
jgi:hypothetical protein